MTPRSNEITWSKIFAVCGSILIPFVSFIFMAGGWYAEIKTNLGKQTTDIQDVKSDIKDIRADQRSLHQQIDTISMRQHDAQLERNYQFKYLQAKK